MATILKNKQFSCWSGHLRVLQNIVAKQLKLAPSNSLDLFVLLFFYLNLTMKKAMVKIFIIFPVILLLLNCQKDSTKFLSKNEVNTKQETSVTIIDVEFLATGSFSLNTLIHQRGKSFTLFGRNTNDQKSSPINTTKPTVFTSYRIENNKTISKQYISFGNDTLSFKFNENASLFVGNKKNNILNILFPENEDFHSIEKQSSPILYFENLANQHQLQSKELESYSKDYTKEQLIILKDYLKLYYYFKIFNVDFSTINSAEAKEKLATEYENLLQNVDLLNKINTILTKQIIYNSLRYTAFINNSNQLYKNIISVDKRLRNTEAMSGFLDDLLQFSANTLSTEDKNEIKKYLPKHTLPPKKNFTNLKTSVLSATVKNRNNNNVKISQILTANQENLVLVDLWATWCNPCLQENPFWENAKKKYAGKIKFVKLSIDIDKDKWLKYLQKHGQEEDAFNINTPQHPLIKEFKISEIPRFILFDNNFRILSDDFIRPSDSNFEIEIEKFLTPNF